MSKNIIYLILSLIIACSRAPHYENWRVGNWTAYDLGGEKVLYSIQENKGEGRYLLNVSGCGFCMNVLIERGKILKILDQDSVSIDFEGFVSGLMNQDPVGVKDTILEDKRITMKLLNDSLAISAQVPIFGIVRYGNIQLIDFGYGNPKSIEELSAKASS